MRCSIFVACLLSGFYLADNRAIASHRGAGCQGGSGCAGQQAGCRGESAGCHGSSGGRGILGGRFGRRDRGAGCVGGNGCSGNYGGCHGGSAGTYSRPVQAYVAPANCPGGVCPAPSAPVTPPAVQPTPMPKGSTQGVLEEVNVIRVRRGLRPFIFDGGLARAAERCASFRAERRIEGHVMQGGGDFQFLPAGTQATAAGCAALDASWGFQACCVDGDYVYAGAASVAGHDGRIYHQIFVR
jgi:hypothetical protein